MHSALHQQLPGDATLRSAAAGSEAAGSAAAAESCLDSMSVSGLALLGRQASRVRAGLSGRACSGTSRNSLEFSGNCTSVRMNHSLLPARRTAMTQNALLGPVRLSPLRTLARIAAPPQQRDTSYPSLRAAAAAAAAAAVPPAARCLSSSSSSSTTAVGGSSNGAEAAGGEAVGDSTGVENEGAEKIPVLDRDASQPPDSDDVQKLKAALAATREASAAANAKVRELQDKLLRALAEQENARVRLAKEAICVQVVTAREYAVSGFAKALLEVGDSLSFAREQLQRQIEKQEKETFKTELQQFLDGIQLTENLFHQTLKKFGVQQYDPMGEKFNPALHEALFQMDGPSEKVGSVAQVVQRGYMIRDRVLRAAKVGVVKGE
ncbi:hypothetical protein Esti_004254 [Eimeria stiedai]